MTADLVEVGQLTAPHGIRGRLRFHPMVEDITPLSGKVSFFDKFGKPVKMTLVKTSCRPLLVQVDGIDTRTKAETMRGTRIFVERSVFPDLGSDVFYFFELKGMTVKTVDDVDFGVVVSVANFGASDVLEIEKIDGTCKDYAFIESVFPKVDKKAGILYIQEPLEVETRP